MASTGGTPLHQIIEGLRGGDLSFVFIAARRLGPEIAAHPGAPVAGHDRFVHDVVLALADLASDPTAVSWSADEVLAAAVTTVVACHTPSP